MKNQIDFSPFPRLYQVFITLGYRTATGSSQLRDTHRFFTYITVFKMIRYWRIVFRQSPYIDCSTFKLQDLLPSCFLRKTMRRRQKKEKEQSILDGSGKVSFHNHIYNQLSFLRTVIKKSCLVPSVAVAFVEPTFNPFKVKVMLSSAVRKTAIELSSTLHEKVIFSPFLK